MADAVWKIVWVHCSDSTVMLWCRAIESHDDMVEDYGYVIAPHEQQKKNLEATPFSQLCNQLVETLSQSHSLLIIKMKSILKKKIQNP